uniref:WGS project CAEQ00000000 data, annotated contig 2039 n=1 Tax=Trypanosoma congolense (strain IL3000) TaxID=1068625 RepID=F9WAZ3_TRYCI|nr:unnamed protein product [Trypanosoma congolense IL3000]
MCYPECGGPELGTRRLLFGIFEKYDVIPCSPWEDHAMQSETSSIRDRHASAVQHHTIFRDPMRCSSQDNGSREVYASSYTGRQAVTGEMLTIPSTSWSPGAKLLPAHPVRSTDDSPSFPASPAPELLTTLNSNSHGERLHSTGSLLRNLTLREKSALIVQLAWKKWKAHRREAAERAIVNRK